MKTAENRNPGDPDARTFVERTIRVDQAGEFGAVRIDEGQLAALRWTGRGRGEASRKIAAMAQAERKHNKEFDRLLVARRVRPTLLSPLWSVAGFALGAATALMGEKAAMACTVAVICKAYWGALSDLRNPTLSSSGCAIVSSCSWALACRS